MTTCQVRWENEDTEGWTGNVTVGSRPGGWCYTGVIWTVDEASSCS